MTYRASYLSPLGAITLASDGKALTGLWFDGQKYFGSTLPQQAESGAGRTIPAVRQSFRYLKRRGDGWTAILRGRSRASRRRCTG